jgi:uncharacterized protein YbjT (DUF2867 family)
VSRSVFVTGGSGYIGRRLIPLLATRGHELKALIRKGSESRIAGGTGQVIGDALRIDSYTEEVRGADTFVHLIGVPRPSPAKARQFHDVDLVSIEVAVKAARDAGIRHFVYLSVAQPAPVMKVFLEVPGQGEEMIRASGIPATFVRPWYVLGPGHRWPYLLLPFYWIAERLPATKESARRLGLITIDQMLNALAWTIENPPTGIRVIDVARIRELG